jgi:hypothetical protein
MERRARKEGRGEGRGEERRGEERRGEESGGGRKSQPVSQVRSEQLA